MNKRFDERWTCEGDWTPAVSRRALLGGGALAAVWWAARGTALADLSLGDQPDPTGDLLVVVFLRGGADGMNMVAPVGADAYHRARPTLALARATDRTAPKADRVLDLDGFFGLNPAMGPLLPLYREGRLGFVHACGSGDHTRSHFEAMAAMERGNENIRGGIASGWLARHLDARPQKGASPLRAVAFSSVMPDSLRGATSAMALESLADFRLRLPEGPENRGGRLRQTLTRLYQDQLRDPIVDAGVETFKLLETLNRLDPAHYKPESGAAYPDSELGRGLRQVAFLAKARVGLEVAFLDRGGWDTHVAQGSSTGYMALGLTDVSDSLAAFAKDLGPALDRTTVVVMTEFGRRLQENSGLGTDHGRGSVMTVLGGGTQGGRVHAKWPGLEPHELDEVGDLRVTTDYRDVLAEILDKRVRSTNLAAVFPGHTPKALGVVQ
ncbi:MAG: DUF1501 domain-containing protein [Fimbriimonadaceae bacterium]|nr:DUF1501 domain-containing protein [Chthonomonadaceae bacterium]MCO5298246.1 DUF1501 domain-containing protein [Fimbriimonadaceae bacterium]